MAQLGAAVAAVALGPAPELGDQNGAPPSRHGCHAVILVADEDQRVALLVGVLPHRAVGLKCLERAALEIFRVREHDTDGDERATIVVLAVL